MVGEPSRRQAAPDALDLSRVRLVVFDAVGTLIEPDPPVSQAYADHARALGLDVSVADVKGRFRAAMARQFEQDAVAQGRTDPRREVERWRQIVAHVFPEMPDTASLFDRLWQHFAEPRHWRVAPEASRAVAQLDQAGLAWAMGSNFDDRLFGVQQGLPELATCPRERVFVSARVGWLKPYAGFFRGLEQATGCSSDQIALVGDDRRNDYEGARAAGWQAVLIEGPASWQALTQALDA